MNSKIYDINEIEEEFRYGLERWLGYPLVLTTLLATELKLKLHLKDNWNVKYKLKALWPTFRQLAHTITLQTHKTHTHYIYKQRGENCIFDGIESLLLHYIPRRMMTRTLTLQLTSAEKLATSRCFEKTLGLMSEDK
jgi:hypothetical protein